MLKAIAILTGAAATACMAMIGLTLSGSLPAPPTQVFALPAGVSLFSVAALTLALEVTDPDGATPAAPSTDARRPAG